MKIYFAGTSSLYNATAEKKMLAKIRKKGGGLSYRRLFSFYYIEKKEISPLFLALPDIKGE